MPRHRSDMRARLFDADNRAAVRVGQLLAAGLLLMVWQFGGGDPFYVSRPSLIAVQFLHELADRHFYVDLRVTATEMALGYGIGAVVGVSLGVVLGRWAFVARLLDPFLVALNSVPRIAIAPMLIVWLGIDMGSKIFLAATLVFFITFFNTLSGVRGVDAGLCNVARVQGAGDWQIFVKVMLPAASSWILTGLKMSLPFALVGVILGEFMVSSRGLGYRLNFYSTSYNTTGALTMIGIMMLVTLVLTTAFDWLERHLMRWRPAMANFGELPKP
jgi:NitT/TauT family transport system permease protein